MHVNSQCCGTLVERHECDLYEFESRTREYVPETLMINLPRGSAERHEKNTVEGLFNGMAE
jgi:hypothetical protein